MSDLGIGLAMVASWDHEFLSASLKALERVPDRFVFVSKLGWDGGPSAWETCSQMAEEAGARVVTGDWPDESSHRSAALSYMRENGFDYALIVDSDEVVSAELLDVLMGLAELDRIDLVRARLATYFLSPTLRIRPDETIAPIVLLNCRRARHRHIREYGSGPGERSIVLGPEFGLIHHLSWVGSEERIERKLETSSHRPEFVPNWKEQVWNRFKQDRTLRNLHPTHPYCYASALRVPLDPVLEGVTDLYPVPDDPPLTESWPVVSIVIPLHGGPEDIRACLGSLERAAHLCRDGSSLSAKRSSSKRKTTLKGDAGLIHEVIVVDDASPDEAADVVATEFPWVKLIRSGSNLGFGATCNRGLQESTGHVVVFLNSDTRVPRGSLIRLVETMMASGSVGAAGPYSNNAGYHQPFPAGYEDIGNLDLFARDFADREVEDTEVPMLVGFCLAVRRSVLNEVGPFDTRFGRGLFEDNDLVYRIQRAGFKTMLSTRSYVHHEGSRSLDRMQEHPHVLLERNKKLFEEKWRLDIETGFASHLPGQVASPIVFNQKRRPERVLKELKRLAVSADVGLAMIVRDEEPRIGACLASTLGLFSKMIVVDTGSKDRTVEIAREHGAEVHEIPWPDSFAAARNESIRHCRTKWLFWMDADDVLPFDTLEKIIRAAASARRPLNGFVIAVQFVEEGRNAGTRVDHVKLVRNLPGVKFEGRIHEQVLPSIRSLGGEIAALDAVVLHAGYDTSEAGQRKKRIRDRKLLWLDYQERPDHPFVLFNLGMTAHFLGRHRVATRWLKRSIAKSGGTDTHLRAAYALMGSSQRALGRHETALQTFFKGLEVVGEDPQLQFEIGATYRDMGRFPESRQAFLTMRTDTLGFFSSIDIGILTYKRLFNLGYVCEEMGLFREAQEHRLAAIEANPAFTPSAEKMFELALRLGDLVTARKAADAVLQGSGPCTTWATMRATIAEVSGVSPDDELMSLAREHPASTAPGMELAQRMLDRGEFAAALPLLERLDAWGCARAVFYRGIYAINLGDYGTALYHMRRCLQLDPASEQARSQIALLKQRIDPEEGRGYVA